MLNGMLPADPPGRIVMERVSVLTHVSPSSNISEEDTSQHSPNPKYPAMKLQFLLLSSQLPIIPSRKAFLPAIEQGVLTFHTFQPLHHHPIERFEKDAS